MEELDNFETGESGRPQFLTVICILSFIGSGVWALFSLMGALATKAIFGLLERVLNNDEVVQKMTDKDLEILEKVIDFGQGGLLIIFVISLLLAITSLLGVIKMWQLNKVGFIIYSAVNGLLLIYDIATLNVVVAIINLGFIVMYAINRKHLQ